MKNNKINTADGLKYNENGAVIRLGLDLNTVKNLIDDGTLKTHLVDGEELVTLQSIEEFENTEQCKYLQHKSNENNSTHFIK